MAIISGNGINTGTFTRPKKSSSRKIHPPTMSCPNPEISSFSENGLGTVDADAKRTEMFSIRDGGLDIIDARAKRGLQKSYSSDALSDEESGVHRLAHVGDVQVIARMQEESEYLWLVLLCF